MKLLFRYLIFSVIFSFSITTIAQEDCPALVEFALSSTNELCTDTARNQACFGHVNLSAEGQPDARDFEFVNVGDIVDVAAIRSLRLSTLDTSAGAWGVVLMRVQANLPNSIPGQNVTFMLFGDTEIRNAATSVAEQELTNVSARISSSSNANVRVGPNSTMAVLASIENGETVVANGANSAGDWIRIELPDGESFQSGWISRQLLIPDGDFSVLEVINPGQPQFGPMQAFYLTTGIGDPACNEMPDNGLLVQTPKGVGEINLLVNEVEISMGSTVFFTAPENENNEGENGNRASSMMVKTIEGAAKTKSNGKTTVALGGSEFEVSYDESGEIDEVSNVASYEEDDVDNLPYESLEREVEYEEPLTDEEIEIVNDYADLFDIVEIDETDELLDYLDEFGEDDLLNFLQDELGYDYFDGDMAEYLEDDLGFDLDGFDDEAFDEDFDDEFDDYGYDDYGDDYGYDDAGYDDYNFDDYGYDDYGYDNYDYDDGGGDYDYD